MIEYINEVLVGTGVSPKISIYIANIILFIIVILISLFVDFIFKNIVLKFVDNVVKRTKTRWDDIFHEKKGFLYMTHIAPAIVLYTFAPAFSSGSKIIHKIISIYIILIVTLVVLKFIKSLEALYGEFEVSKRKPIRGYIQVFGILTVIIGFIILVSSILNKSPAILLSGIGAATAIIMLIFKDVILGLVAGIQINTNNMIKLGDWIEMPSHDADGDVIEISLTTVKVRNFDKTITNIPIYALVSNSFKNWMGMFEWGGRRIKRPIYIDMTSIKICTREMVEEYKRIDYISEYVSEMNEEIETYNKKWDESRNVETNRKRLTNIGIFRSYVISYLKHHPQINQDMLLLVRQLDPTPKGLPLEVYAFTKTTTWTEYEPIQADIFDHLLAILPEFDLKVFQDPTGRDFARY